MAPQAAAAAQPRYATVDDLFTAVQDGVVIDTAHCAEDLFDELVRWLDMLSEKSNARVQDERAKQDEITRMHTVHWEARGQAGHRYRTAAGSKGQTRESRASTCQSWDPDAPGATPPYVGDVEAARRETAKSDNRLNERIAAAIRKWHHYASAAGSDHDLHACRSAELIRYNSHRGDKTPALPNWPDERRCPRCYAPGHQEERFCPLRATLTATVAHGPVVISRGPLGGGRVVDDRGDPLDGGEVPLCRLCGLYGHYQARCAFCTQCRRHGHTSFFCGSELTRR
jgi:hypothetical protein